MAALNTYVHVRDEHGVDHVFGPGSTVPKWARDAITNPDVWADNAEQGAPTPVPAKTPDAGEEPPRGGKGSGAAAWKAHAVSLGIAVPDDASKPDIIALVDAQKAGSTSTAGEAEGAGIPASDASREDWIAYAATQGLEIDADDDVPVEDLIKVLEANDVTTK